MPAPLQPPAPPDPPDAFLFSDEVIKELTDQEQRHGIYTGERCPDDLKRSIVKLVGDGWSQREIARTLKTAPETVRNVAHHCRAEIRDYLEQLPRRLQRCIISGLDRLERHIESVPMQSMGITLKALHDIETAASGRVSARIEHVHRVDLFSDWKDYVASLERLPGDPIRAKNGAGMHLAGEKTFLMDAPAADPELAGDPQAESDGNSLVSGAFSEETPAHLPTFPPTSPTPADNAAAGETVARAQEGGGGESAIASPTEPAKDDPSQKFLGNGL